MPPKTTIEKKKKRSSVTDTMFSPAEKILSAVARKLIVVLDSDSDSAEVNKYWKSATRPCVVVPGPKGASKYVYHIRGRLKHEGFRFDGGAKLWYRPKLPNQMTLQEQADWIKSCVARMWD